MAALIALAATGIVAAGVAAGFVGVVSVAIGREEKDLALASEDPATGCGTGWWLNGVFASRTPAADPKTGPA